MVVAFGESEKGVVVFRGGGGMVEVVVEWVRAEGDGE